MTREVVGVGEILWDLFPDEARFGGAPANFACHVAALGGDACVVSRVGSDELGRRALQELQQRGVKTDFIATDPTRATGTVDVTSDANGVASYRFASDVAWDALVWSDDLQPLATGADAICFGTLGQRKQQSRDTIRRFVAATSESCLRIFDANLRPPFFDKDMIFESLNLANVLKVNDEELPVVADAAGVSGSVEDTVRELARRCELQCISVTRGARGAMLLVDGHVVESAGRDVTVVDTVGAGDAFTAALAMGLLRRNSHEHVLYHAVEVAAFVCTQPGATPALPAHLRQWK
jgi:fructokinase